MHKQYRNYDADHGRCTTGYVDGPLMLNIQIELQTVNIINNIKQEYTTIHLIYSDISPPILIITDSRTIEVWWSAPATPNGLIINYEVSYQAVDGSLTYTVIYTGLPLILMYRHNTGLIPTWVCITGQE